METLKANVIFRMWATDDGDVWWKDDARAPPHLTDWRANHGLRTAGARPSIPIALYRCRDAVSSLAPEWDNPKACRSRRYLLARGAAIRCRDVEATSWEDGSISGDDGSETTAAATGKVGESGAIRSRMLPLGGYHIGDYFRHWLGFARRGVARPPKISRSTGSAPTRTGHSSGRASVRTCGVEWIVDSMQRSRARCGDGARIAARVSRSGLARSASVRSARASHAPRARTLETRLAAHDQLFAQLGSKQPHAFADLRRHSAQDLADDRYAT